MRRGPQNQQDLCQPLHKENPMMEMLEAHLNWAKCKTWQEKEKKLELLFMTSNYPQIHINCKRKIELPFWTCNYWQFNSLTSNNKAKWTLTELQSNLSFTKGYCEPNWNSISHSKCLEVSMRSFMSKVKTITIFLPTTVPIWTFQELLSMKIFDVHIYPCFDKIY